MKAQLRKGGVAPQDYQRDLEAALKRTGKQSAAEFQAMAATLAYRWKHLDHSERQVYERQADCEMKQYMERKFARDCELIRQRKRQEQNNTRDDHSSRPKMTITTVTTNDDDTSLPSSSSRGSNMVSPTCTTAEEASLVKLVEKPQGPTMEGKKFPQLPDQRLSMMYQHQLQTLPSYYPSLGARSRPAPPAPSLARRLLDTCQDQYILPPAPKTAPNLLHLPPAAPPSFCLLLSYRFPDSTPPVTLQDGPRRILSVQDGIGPPFSSSCARVLAAEEKKQQALRALREA